MQFGNLPCIHAYCSRDISSRFTSIDFLLAVPKSENTFSLCDGHLSKAVSLVTSQPAEAICRSRSCVRLTCGPTCAIWKDRLHVQYGRTREASQKQIVSRFPSPSAFPSSPGRSESRRRTARRRRSMKPSRRIGWRWRRGRRVDLIS
jgi:hypothetical protein